MTQNESKLFHTYIEYYNELINGHLIEGAAGVVDPTEIQSIAAGIATVFTVNKIIKEDKTE